MLLQGDGMSHDADWFRRAVSMRAFNSLYPHNAHKPSAQKVIWLTDQPGNGLCVPRDRALGAWMQERYGLDGVAYAHGEPDLEPFVETITPEGLTSEAFVQYRRETLKRSHPEVVCEAAEGVRCQFSLEDTISGRRDVNERVCFCRIAEAMGGNVTRQVVDDYFHYRGLTCHEPSDLHTLQVIPQRINAVFSHTAGISTVRHSEQFLDAEAGQDASEAAHEEAGMKIKHLSNDDSQRIHHGEEPDMAAKYAEVFPEIDRIISEGLMKARQLRHAPEFQNRDYAQLAMDIQDGAERMKSGFMEGNTDDVTAGYQQCWPAVQQIDEDYAVLQQVDRLYGTSPEQEKAQAQDVDRLYGTSPEQEKAQAQDVDRLYGASLEQEQLRDTAGQMNETAAEERCSQEMNNDVTL